MNFKKVEKGDRVIIITTPNREEGKVIDDKVYEGMFASFREPKIRVRLDTSGEEKNLNQEYLEVKEKKPSQKKAIEAVDKIKEQLNKIPNMPPREKGELPNHLEYFKEDIQVDNKLIKQLGLTNLDYVDKTLQALEKTSSTADCWKEIKNNLAILRWWTE